MTAPNFRIFKDGFKALVIGSSGGIGAAVAGVLEATARCSELARLSRTERPDFDLLDEDSIARAAQILASRHGQFHLVFDATGALSLDGAGPEKTMAALDPAVMAKSYAVNAIGPALLLKHFHETLPRKDKCVFATLSARVGSIEDNRLGGWYSYRAAKAALNQIFKSAAIEIARKRPNAVCLALHPGTVETNLTRQYARGRFTHSRRDAALQLLAVVDDCARKQEGGFFAYDGSRIPW